MAVANAQLGAKFAARGPKRILSLDGGGVRGVLALGMLEQIEQRLKRRSGKADFRLCDYFDLIGGTSTGSIIAAGLAFGRSVSELSQLYQDLAPKVFGSDDANAGLRRARFDADKLDAALAREFGEHELGSAAFKTGFAVFAKRIDTGSAWTLTNNPNSKFWEGPAGGFPNRRFQVRQLIRASAAAPTFFDECSIRLIPEGEPVPPGADSQGEFVDGGVAALNDPSLQLLKVAALSPYGFSWPTGDDRLLMISVGTGYWRPALRYDTLENDLLHTLAPAAARAVFALKSMIHDASLSTLVTMQGLSTTPRPWRINGEIEEMRGARLSPVPLLHFQRFDARLDDEAEMRKLGLEYSQASIEAMKEMSSSDDATLAHLQEIGRRAGENYFRRREKHEPDWESAIFPARFDPDWFTGAPAGPPRTRIEAMGRVFGSRAPRK
ncbi:MAG: patatin-like phospholipase family protein [Hyphomonadaceae bacterium]|nr:patatin-like phospholipase family protein [Hyphomonadaceae bacterium]